MEKVIEKVIDCKVYVLAGGRCRECAFFKVAECAAMTGEVCLEGENEGKAWREKG